MYKLYFGRLREVGIISSIVIIDLRWDEPLASERDSIQQSDLFLYFNEAGRKDSDDRTDAGKMYKENLLQLRLHRQVLEDTLVF